MRFPATWVFASLWLAVVVGLVAPAPALADDTTARLIELTNVERQKHGLPPLVANPSLGKAAQAYAELLASTSCWGHDCGPVPDFSQRISLAGYMGWTIVGENLAGGQPTPERAVAAWMESPAHRANVLNPRFREIGVGAAAGGRYRFYWVQEFGARRGDPATPTPTALVSPGRGAPSDDERQDSIVQGSERQADEGFRFVLGFKRLAEQIPHVVGLPLENERYDPVSGDTVQRTTNGLLVWRPSGNWTAFTDGYRTWLNGPLGLQVRLNTERFPWEE